MKAITIKAPIAWVIFNAGLITLYRNEHIEPNTQLVIHAGKFCTSSDVENFSKKSGLVIPPPSRFSSGGTSFGIYAIRDHAKEPYQIRWAVTMANPTASKKWVDFGIPWQM